jgi:hypothetical protein
MIKSVIFDYEGVHIDISVHSTTSNTLGFKLDTLYNTTIIKKSAV